jgi:hypothetical protein
VATPDIGAAFAAPADNRAAPCALLLPRHPRRPALPLAPCKVGRLALLSELKITKANQRAVPPFTKAQALRVTSPYRRQAHEKN